MIPIYHTLKPRQPSQAKANKVRGLKNLAVAMALLGLSACSFVEVNPGAEHIILSNAGDNCKRLGQTTVSVLHEVAYIDRNPETIEQELQILAQNAAAKMGGNAIWPVSEVAKGSRDFAVYRCQLNSL